MSTRANGRQVTLKAHSGFSEQSPSAQSGVSRDVAGSVKRHNMPCDVSQGVYRKPRTGEKRARRKPLRIDKLPAAVKDAIVAARNAGETWKETARIASACAGVKLAPSSVQRWHDIRIEQAGEANVLLRKIAALLECILEEVRR